MCAQATESRYYMNTTCLIIEDSTFDQQMMARVIAKTPGKIRVEVASTLQSARAALKHGEINLILLDNNLPDGLGANFALELASNPNLANIPIIMVSDWPTPFMWEKAASAGVLHVVNKSEFGARYVQEVMRKRKTVRSRVN